MEPYSQRKLERRQLVVYLRVGDRDSGRELGYLADITTEGLMLVSNDPVEIGRVYRLEVEPAEAGSGVPPIHLDGRSLWTRPDVNPALHLTGFELVDPGADEIRAINALIVDLGFGE